MRVKLISTPRRPKAHSGATVFAQEVNQTTKSFHVNVAQTLRVLLFLRGDAPFFVLHAHRRRQTRQADKRMDKCQAMAKGLRKRFPLSQKSRPSSDPKQSDAKDGPDLVPFIWGFATSWRGLAQDEKRRAGTENTLSAALKREPYASTIAKCCWRARFKREKANQILRRLCAVLGELAITDRFLAKFGSN